MVAPIVIGAAIGAGAGLLKQQEEERQFKERSKLAAEQTALSSFNPEIRPGQLGARPSMFQNVLQGALAGGGVGNKNASQFGGGESDGTPTQETLAARAETEQAANLAHPAGDAPSGFGEAAQPQPLAADQFQDPNILVDKQSNFAGAR